MPAGSMLDFDRMVAALAAERPWWQPGNGHGYHVNTFGFLAGQLIRAVTGLLPGQYLARELAGPLGADVHIGLRPQDEQRVADFRWGDSRTDGPPAVGAHRFHHTLGEAQMAVSAYANPPDFSGQGVVNSVAWRRAQVPSANAHASADGIARLYAALAAQAAPSTGMPPWTAARSPPRSRSRCTGRIWSCAGRRGSVSASS